MTSDPPVLKIFVFGSTEGESIVLRLPNGKWGVVDSFASSLADPTTNPALQLLKGEQAKELEFLCLTHPHDDHYRGMSQLLAEFKVQRFWTFAGDDPKDIQLFTTYFLAEAEQVDRGVLKESAAELISIFNLVERRRIRREAVVSRRLMYPVPGDDSLSIEISGLAPTDDRAKVYKKALMKSLFKNPGAVLAMPHARHNTISVGLRVTFGKARVVLGGDVERQAWTTILDEQGAANLASHFVKISHHGSTTGYCPGLWAILSGNGSSRPVAALTPFKRFKLPDPAALDEMRPHVRSIHSASRSGHAQRSENWRLAALARLMAASAGKAPAPAPAATVGCCEIEVNDQGECRVTHHGSACVVYEAEAAPR